jgi:hypothetical protein
MSEREPISLHGSCHCNAVKITFATCQLPMSIHPRACDCSFCRKHAAAYVSDPRGSLLIECESRESLLNYRQGSGNADFLMCAHCGVLVAVTFNGDTITYGAVNSACLDRFAEFADAFSSSPQLLSTENKVSRWTEFWVPDVRFSYIHA